jgi:hypothetical protein
MIAGQIDVVQDSNDYFCPWKWFRIDNVVEIPLIEIVVIAIGVVFWRFHSRTAHVTLMTISF